MTIGLERVLAPEVLFNPELAGLDCLSIQSSIYKVIQRIKSEETKKELLQNIVLSGGSK